MSLLYPAPERPSLQARRPLRWTWALLLLLLLAAGVALTLWRWPAGQARELRFWCWALLLPGLVWLSLYLLRWLYYEQQVHAVTVRHTQADIIEAGEMAWVTAPLLLLAGAYRVADLVDEGLAAAVTEEAPRLVSRTDEQSGEVLRFTRIAELPTLLPELTLTLLRTEHARRQLDLLHQLLRSLVSALARLPDDWPLSAWITAEGLTDKELNGLWSAACLLNHLPVLPMTRHQPGDDLPALQHWLDTPGGDALARAVIVIHLQPLASPPVPESAEAGCALLLCWHDMPGDNPLTPLAALHRPVSADASQLLEVWIAAMQAGGVEDSSAVTHLWQAGLAPDIPAQLYSDFQTRYQQPLELPANSWQNLDRAVGHAGSAALWLGVLAAAEQLATSPTPQLVAHSQDKLLAMLLLQPAAPRPITESSL